MRQFDLIVIDLIVKDPGEWWCYSTDLFPFSLFYSSHTPKRQTRLQQQQRHRSWTHTERHARRHPPQLLHPNSPLTLTALTADFFAG
jgi:hypothetical protein